MTDPRPGTRRSVKVELYGEEFRLRCTLGAIEQIEEELDESFPVLASKLASKQAGGFRELVRILDVMCKHFGVAADQEQIIDVRKLDMTEFAVLSASFEELFVAHGVQSKKDDDEDSDETKEGNGTGAE